jgi:hypothetical protein
MAGRERPAVVASSLDVAVAALITIFLLRLIAITLRTIARFAVALLARIVAVLCAAGLTALRRLLLALRVGRVLLGVLWVIHSASLSADGCATRAPPIIVRTRS